MYVIFPADEVVYLSYGHLIYVPSTPQPDNELRTPPIRTPLDNDQPSFPATPASSSNRSNQSEGKISNKENPNFNKNWDKFDSIGFRSIDLESRGSVNKSRSDGFTLEARTPPNCPTAQLISRSNIINRSGLINQRSNTSQYNTVLKEHKNFDPEPSTSGYNQTTPKNLDPSESRYSFDRYKTPSRSLKAKSPVNTQEPDDFKLFSSLNRPKKPTTPIEEISKKSTLFRLGKPPIGHNIVDINKPETENGKPRPLNKSITNNLENQRSKSKELRSENINRSDSKRLLQSKSLVETDLGYKNLGTTELNSLGKQSSTFRSISTSDYKETEITSPKTSESPDSSYPVRKKSSSRFLRTQEEENKTLERAYNSNSTKSSKSSKNSSNSSKSSVAKTQETKVSLIRPRTISDSVACPKTDQPRKKISSNSFRSFLRSSVSKEKTPEPPVRPDRRKDRIFKDTILDSPAPNRELISRSDLINTRSDQVQDYKSEKPVLKREKSPVIRFFRAQSSSPRTLSRDKSAFDFDGLFKQDQRRLNINSIRHTTYFGSDTNLTNLSGKISGEAE